MRPSLLKNQNNNRHLTPEELENNIEGLAVTDSQLRALFDNLDENRTGLLDFETVMKYYKEQENYGLEPSDAEVEDQLRRYAKSPDNTINFDEFASLVLSLVQRGKQMDPLRRHPNETGAGWYQSTDNILTDTTSWKSDDQFRLFYENSNKGAESHGFGEGAPKKPSIVALIRDEIAFVVDKIALLERELATGKKMRDGGDQNDDLDALWRDCLPSSSTEREQGRSDSSLQLVQHHYHNLGTVEGRWKECARTACHLPRSRVLDMAHTKMGIMIIKSALCRLAAAGDMEEVEQILSYYGKNHGEAATPWRDGVDSSEAPTAIITVENTKDRNGATLLHIASAHGQFPLVKLLLGKYKANIFAVDHTGNTPLIMAKMKYSYFTRILREMTTALTAAESDEKLYFEQSNNNPDGDSNFSPMTKGGSNCNGSQVLSRPMSSTSSDSANQQEESNKTKHIKKITVKTEDIEQIRVIVQRYEDIINELEDCAIMEYERMASKGVGMMLSGGTGQQSATCQSPLQEKVSSTVAVLAFSENFSSIDDNNRPFCAALPKEQEEKLNLLTSTPDNLLKTISTHIRKEQLSDVDPSIVMRGGGERARGEKGVPVFVSSSGQGEGHPHRRVRNGLVLILVGVPGCGKSYCCQQINRYFHWYGIECTIITHSAFREGVQRGLDKINRNDEIFGEKEMVYSRLPSVYLHQQRMIPASSEEDIAVTIAEYIRDIFFQRPISPVSSAIPEGRGDLYNNGSVIIINGTHGTKTRRSFLQQQILARTHLPKERVIFIELINRNKRMVYNNILRAKREAEEQLLLLVKEKVNFMLAKRSVEKHKAKTLKDREKWNDTENEENERHHSISVLPEKKVGRIETTITYDPTNNTTIMISRDSSTNVVQMSSINSITKKVSSFTVVPAISMLDKPNGDAFENKGSKVTTENEHVGGEEERNAAIMGTLLNSVGDSKALRKSLRCKSMDMIGKPCFEGTFQLGSAGSRSLLQDGSLSHIESTRKGAGTLIEASASIKDYHTWELSANETVFSSDNSSRTERGQPQNVIKGHSYSNHCYQHYESLSSRSKSGLPTHVSISVSSCLSPMATTARFEDDNTVQGVGPSFSSLDHNMDGGDQQHEGINNNNIYVNTNCEHVVAFGDQEVLIIPTINLNFFIDNFYRKRRAYSRVYESLDGSSNLCANVTLITSQNSDIPNKFTTTKGGEKDAPTTASSDVRTIPSIASASLINAAITATRAASNKSTFSEITFDRDSSEMSYIRIIDEKRMEFNYISGVTATYVAQLLLHTSNQLLNSSIYNPSFMCGTFEAFSKAKLIASILCGIYQPVGSIYRNPNAFHSRLSLSPITEVSIATPHMTTINVNNNNNNNNQTSRNSGMPTPHPLLPHERLNTSELLYRYINDMDIEKGEPDYYMPDAMYGDESDINYRLRKTLKKLGKGEIKKGVSSMVSPPIFPTCETTEETGITPMSWMTSKKEDGTETCDSSSDYDSDEDVYSYVFGSLYEFNKHKYRRQRHHHDIETQKETINNDKENGIIYNTGAESYVRTHVNLQATDPPLYLTLPGLTDDMTAGILGGDNTINERGEAYSQALFEFMFREMCSYKASSDSIRIFGTGGISEDAAAGVSKHHCYPCYFDLVNKKVTHTRNFHICGQNGYQNMFEKENEEGKQPPQSNDDAKKNLKEKAVGSSAFFQCCKKCRTKRLFSKVLNSPRGTMDNNHHLDISVPSVGTQSDVKGANKESRGEEVVSHGAAIISGFQTGYFEYKEVSHLSTVRNSDHDSCDLLDPDDRDEENLFSDYGSQKTTVDISSPVSFKHFDSAGGGTHGLSHSWERFPVISGNAGTAPVTNLDALPGNVSATHEQRGSKAIPDPQLFNIMLGTHQRLIQTSIYFNAIANYHQYYHDLYNSVLRRSFMEPAASVSVDFFKNEQHSKRKESILFEPHEQQDVFQIPVFTNAQERFPNWKIEESIELKECNCLKNEVKNSPQLQSTNDMQISAYFLNDNPENNDESICEIKESCSIDQSTSLLNKTAYETNKQDSLSLCRARTCFYSPQGDRFSLARQNTQFFSLTRRYGLSTDDKNDRNSLAERMADDRYNIFYTTAVLGMSVPQLVLPRSRSLLKVLVPDQYHSRSLSGLPNHHCVSSHYNAHSTSASITNNDPYYCQHQQPSTKHGVQHNSDYHYEFHPSHHCQMNKHDEHSLCSSHFYTTSISDYQTPQSHLGDAAIAFICNKISCKLYNYPILNNIDYGECDGVSVDDLIEERVTMENAPASLIMSDVSYEPFNQSFFQSRDNYLLAKVTERKVGTGRVERKGLGGESLEGDAGGEGIFQRRNRNDNRDKTEHKGQHIKYYTEVIKEGGEFLDMKFLTEPAINNIKSDLLIAETRDGDDDMHTIHSAHYLNTMNNALIASNEHYYNNAWPKGESIRQLYVSRLPTAIFEIMSLLVKPLLVIADEIVLQGLLAYFAFSTDHAHPPSWATLTSPRYPRHLHRSVSAGSPATVAAEQLSPFSGHDEGEGADRDAMKNPRQEADSSSLPYGSLGDFDKNIFYFVYKRSVMGDFEKKVEERDTPGGGGCFTCAECGEKVKPYNVEGDENLASNAETAANRVHSINFPTTAASDCHSQHHRSSVRGIFSRHPLLHSFHIYSQPVDAFRQPIPMNTVIKIVSINGYTNKVVLIFDLNNRVDEIMEERKATTAQATEQQSKKNSLSSDQQQAM